MEYSIKQLADLAGVTTRTLRWYDAQGLLPPLRVTDAGYRVYGGVQVDRLQEILFYRELGLKLGEIKALLDHPGHRREAALQSHLSELEVRRTRLDALILTVKKTIDHERGIINMTDKEKFEALKQTALQRNEETYGAELREQYGETTVAESNQKFEALTEEQYAQMEALGAELLARLESAVRGGLDPLGEEGRAIGALHRRWLGFTWPSYSVEAHRGLAQMYVDDERFTIYYDGNVPGCAAFLRDAIHGL